MKVCVGILEYGDPEGLDRLLGSLALGKGGFDGAIVIHGRFATFPQKFENAFEETYAVVEKHKKQSGEYIYLVRCSEDRNISQIEMRNGYLERAANLGFDWLLVMDSDEYIAPNADWKTFREALEFEMSLKVRNQIYDVMFEGYVADRGPRPRLFYRPGSIKYWNKHYWFVLEETKQLLKGEGDAGKVIGGIFLIHDKTIRTPQHYYATLQYEKWLLNSEGVTQ